MSHTQSYTGTSYLPTPANAEPASLAVLGGGLLAVLLLTAAVVLSLKRSKHW